MDRKKVLCIRFSSIGDIILCSPVVRSLSQQLNHEVHFCTKQEYAHLLENNPYISKVHSLDNSSLDSLIDTLQNENFDYVVDLHKKFRSKRIVRKLALPSYSFYKENFEKWLMVDFKIDRLSDKHLVDRYFDGLSELGLTNDGEGLDYFIPEDVSLPSELLTLDGFIVLAIGGSYETKRLPYDQLLKLCDQIEDHPVVIVGGEENRLEAQQIEENTSHKQLINLVSKTSLDETALVIRESEGVISHDTATMHIAAAFDKPIVSVWGNTIPKFGMFPYQNKAEDKSLIFQNNDLHCRPCSKLGYKHCPKGHFKCMNDLSMKRIVEHFEEIKITV